MRTKSWTTVLLVAAGLSAASAHAAPAFLPRELLERTTQLALQVRLSEQASILQSLERRLAIASGDELIARADALGISAVLDTSGLPEPQQRRLSQAIVREADRYGMDPLLIVALIRCESAFNPYAVSSAGAMGLMQVMPVTGRVVADRGGMELGRATNLFDAELNVALGTAYLASLLGQFKTLEQALVAYNVGPALARRVLSSPSQRQRVLAGYPRRVVSELKRLQSRLASSAVTSR